MFVYGTLVCARERDASRTNDSSLPKVRGEKREGKEDMRCEETGLRMRRRIEGGAGRGREGEKSRGKRETAVSLCGDHPPAAVARTQRRRAAFPRPNYRARRATPTVHARNLHPTSISSRRSATQRAALLIIREQRRPGSARDSTRPKRSRWRGANDRATIRSAMSFQRHGRIRRQSRGDYGVSASCISSILETISSPW